MNTGFSFFDSLTEVCRRRLTLLEPEYCPTSLLVHIAQGSVSSWLAPVLLSSSVPISSFHVRMAQGSISDPLDRTILLWSSQSKLNEGSGLNTELFWRSYTITQLSKSLSHKGPYLKRALTIKYCTKYNDSLNESALLVERWTIRYLAVNTLSHCLLC